MLGATLAGIAFSNSSVALVHGMSRPIGAHFHVAHGLSNAMLLPRVTEWSIGGALQRYATCARTIGAADEQVGDQMAARHLVDYLMDLNRYLKVPQPQRLRSRRGRLAIPFVANGRAGASFRLSAEQPPNAIEG